MTMDGWVGLTMICVSQAPCPYLGRQSILYACVLLYSVHTTANKPLDQNHFPSPREESHPVRQPRQPTPPPTGTNKRKRLLIHMPCHDHACFMIASPPAKLCFPHPNTTVPKQNKHNKKHRNVQPKPRDYVPNFRQQQPPQQYPTCFSTAATYPSTAVTAPSTVAIVL